MTTNHDALREALLYPSELPGREGLWLDEHGNYYRLATSKPEPQAQAEPDVVALAMFCDGDFLDAVNPENVDIDDEHYTEPLITLQSHREAMERLHSDYLIELHAKDLEADEKDAALKASVAWMIENATHQAGCGLYGFLGKCSCGLDAAITQAQEAMK